MIGLKRALLGSRAVASLSFLLAGVAVLVALVLWVTVGPQAALVVVAAIAVGVAAARLYLFVSVRGRFDALTYLAHEAVVVVDNDYRVIYASPSAVAVLGLALDRTSRLHPSDVVHPGDLDSVLRVSEAARATPGSHYEVTFRARNPIKGWRWVEVAGTNLLHDSKVGGVVSTIRDVTEQLQLEARLKHLADHDELTSLPSRRPLIAHLEVALANNRRFGGRVAALFLDVDRFKVVNDSLGHQAGDRLLQELASRLSKALRPQDRAGRFGGDEFVIIVPDAAGPSEVIDIADRVRREVGGSFVLGDEEVFVTTSIGIALALGTESPEELLRDADAAMYEAKAGGRDRVKLFDGAMRLQVVERLDIEQSLRRALERDELCVHYQPVVGLGTGRIQGVEALVRWNHPERGLLMPGQFLAVAEETGLIVDIGRLVLREACTQASSWHGSNGTGEQDHGSRSLPGQDGSSGRLLPTYVNLSARQLADANLVNDVQEIIDLTGVHAPSIHFEITEDALMVDTVATRCTLVALRNLGVRLAIDDFGTGYSSLSYLKHFPVDSLKIDKAFVDGLGNDAGDAAITAAIVEVAQHLGLTTVAEGIERLDQAEWLAALGCDLGQGFHYAPAMPVDELADMLALGVV